MFTSSDTPVAMGTLPTQILVSQYHSFLEGKKGSLEKWHFQNALCSPSAQPRNGPMLKSLVLCWEGAAFWKQSGLVFTVPDGSLIARSARTGPVAVSDEYLLPIVGSVSCSQRCFKTGANVHPWTARNYTRK